MNTATSSKLLRLFIFRHCRSLPQGFLTTDGIERSRRLGAALRLNDRINYSKNSIVLCSGGLNGQLDPRTLPTRLTAQWVVSTLDAKPEIRPCPELFADDKVCDVDAAIRLLENIAAYFENIIVVSHVNMVKHFPREFGRQVLGVDDFPSAHVEYGQGYAIGCDRPSCQFFKY
jgi:hypothetical protein